MNQVLINGRAYSWADLKVNILGVLIYGIMAISYEEKNDKENVYGAGGKPVARGYGNTTFDGSITLSVEEVEALEKAAPSGSLAKIPPFSIVVAYVPDGSTKIKTEILKFVEFMGNKRAWKQNDMKGEIEIPLIIGDIDWNA